MDLRENYPAKKVSGADHHRNYTKIKNSVGSEMTAQLKPFKPVMIKLLNKRGYNTKVMSFNDVIPLYYNEFVSNQKNKKSNLVPIDTYEFSENPVFKFSPSDNLNGDIFTHQNRQYFNHVASVTDSIIDNFRRSKLKVQMSGLGNFDTATNISNDELLQGKAAIKIEKDLESKSIGDRPIKIKNLLVIGAVIVLLYYMSK
jgi:hypothetical protein